MAFSVLIENVQENVKLPDFVDFRKQISTSPKDGTACILVGGGELHLRNSFLSPILLIS